MGSTLIDLLDRDRDPRWIKPDLAGDQHSRFDPITVISPPVVDYLGSFRKEDQIVLDGRHLEIADEFPRQVTALR